MAHRSDDSMLFSFKGLFDLERQRVHQEETSRIRQTEVARLELEQRERLAEEARVGWLKAEAETRRQYELRAREEAVRLSALKLAALEHARIQAQSDARLAELEQEQAHQTRLKSLVESNRLRSARRLSAAATALWLFTLAAVATLYFGKLSPENARLQSAYDRLVSAERARSSEATRLLAQAEAQRVALAKENRRLRGQTSASESGRAASASKSRAKSAPTKTATPPDKPCRKDGDPMADCL